MIHEIFVFARHLLALVAIVIFGVLLGGGVWIFVKPAYFPDASPAKTSTSSIELNHVTEQALAAEEAFGISCPGQSYVIRWWGWTSASPSPPLAEVAEERPKHADATARMMSSFQQQGTRISNAVEPWLRLVWIRGVAALAVLVAALLPALALWLIGRRRAYVLLASGMPPSNGQRTTWLVITNVVAFVTGVLIGAPIAAAMAPWFSIALLGSLLSLYYVRTCMPARL